MKKLLLAGLCLSFATSVSAAGLKALPYTYVEASYGTAEFDDLELDADGFSIDASADVGGNVFLHAGYQTLESDEFSVGVNSGTVEVSGFTVGLGYHHALSPTLDLVPSVGFISADAESTGDFAGIVDESDTGYELSLLLRALVAPQLELSGGANRSDIGDDASTALAIRGMFYPTSRLGLGLGYESGDDTAVTYLTARINL